MLLYFSVSIKRKLEKSRNIINQNDEDESQQGQYLIEFENQGEVSMKRNINGV